MMKNSLSGVRQLYRFCNSQENITLRTISSSSRSVSRNTTTSISLVPVDRKLFQLSLSRPSHLSPLCSARPYSATNRKEDDAPSKETLLRVDWMLEHIVPGILKSRMKSFFDICKNDVSFEDKLYNYKLSQKNHLLSHIAKIRMYYRYRSPYNKVERIGSCIYEGEDVIVLLWRLSTLESNFWSYFPSFITKKEPTINTVEGALDLHITKDGQIYKIVNRKITASDREGAKVMAELKTMQEEARNKEEEKDIRRQLDDIIQGDKKNEAGST